ncbi:MAG: PilZ domain-containing protein [Pseudomonadota bacterium]
MATHRQPLEAQILKDGRDSVRYAIRFNASVASTSHRVRALIHDLSETGLRLETASGLDLGDTLIIELPLSHKEEACIVWNKANTYGCEFLKPVSKATVSAAYLSSLSVPPVQSAGGAVKEIAIGVDPSKEEVTAWAAEFDKTKGVTGNQLLGFRKSEDGTVFALVQKGN